MNQPNATVITEHGTNCITSEVDINTGNLGNYEECSFIYYTMQSKVYKSTRAKNSWYTNSYPNSSKIYNLYEQ